MSYKMKGFSGFKPSPAKAKDKKQPDTVKVDQNTGSDRTFENPYKPGNSLKRDTRGQGPLAGPKVFSPTSGIQVGGPNMSKQTYKKTNRQRDNEYNEGKGKAFMGGKLNKTDSNKSGLPDELESGFSEEIRNLAPKNK